MSRSSAPVSLALAVSSACVAFACSSSEPRTFDVRVAVTTRGGEPVPGAEVQLRSEPPAATNDAGQVTLRLSGRAGERVPVTLGCPAGFRAPPGEVALVLPGAPRASRDAAPALELACHADVRTAVVLVRAAGATPSLPVKVDGVVVGQTDSLGFAHLHIQARPATTFEVSLDTSANGALSPADPAQRFRIGAADDLYVFDTAFDTPRPRRKARHEATHGRSAKHERSATHDGRPGRVD